MFFSLFVKKILNYFFLEKKEKIKDIGKEKTADEVIEK